MSDRYIRRFALPERLYTAGAPVVLAAGVLLEDTKLPRLVAQLKWKSIDDRRITSLTISVRCPAGDGAGTMFTYAGLGAVRGQAFGRYTAVVLPWGDQQSMDVRAVSATFADGSVWKAAEDARWESLPAFIALDKAVEEPELLALSRGLPSSRYAYWSDKSLWYCPCGGVNRLVESRCHRCGCQRDTAERLATAAGLAALRQERAEDQARQAREQERREEEARAQAEERREAARQQMEDLKSRLHLKKTPPESSGGVSGTPDETSKTPPAPRSAGAPAESAPLLSNGAEPAPYPEESSLPEEKSSACGKTAISGSAAGRTKKPGAGKKRGRIAAVVAVALLAVAGAVLLPRLGGGDGIGAQELHVTAPGDGETVTFTVEEDTEGVCTVTPELVQAQFPQVEYINLEGVPNMGGDIDPYLVDSFQMAMLVTSRGQWGSEGEWGSFNANTDPDSPLCLLLFDSNTHLMGHAVGVPEKAGNGTWQLQVTLCDYDFTALYEEQMALFDAQREETFANYIAPEDIADSGAKYFLTGYNTGRGPTLLPGDAQAYHLWAEYTSPYVEKHSREMDRLRDRLPRDDRWRCFLLLDGDHQLLGYTMMDSTGSGGQAGGDSDITPTGSVELVLEEKSDGNCEITEELLHRVVPEMSFFNFEGYAPDLGGDVKAYVTDSLHMAWLVTSGGTQNGGHLSATWNLSEDHIFTLLLYRDLTTLCGYFVGAPEDLGGGKWRMEITLCDYDFTALYQEQSAGYTASPQLPEISQYDLASCGAAFYIEPVSQLSGSDDFTNRVRLQSLWSRATSPYISRFCAPITDLPNSARHAAAERPQVYLLLDENMQSLGYVTVTDGERVENMEFSVPSGVRTGAALDLTAEGEYCTVTLEQVQQVVPQARFMEFRGMPDLGGVEEYLKVSDQMAWLVASNGERSMHQTSSRFSVQGGKAPFRVLLLYSGKTALCGYFFGQPRHLGGDSWRMEITLCNYDFSGLYEQQKNAFSQAALPEYIAPEQVERSGAAWCVDGFYLSDDGNFSRAVQQYGLWSREQSVGKERFCKPVEDLDVLMPSGRSDGEIVYAYVLLLDEQYDPVGYTILTN